MDAQSMYYIEQRVIDAEKRLEHVESWVSAEEDFRVKHVHPLAAIASKLDRTNVLLEQLVEALRHMNKVR